MRLLLYIRILTSYVPSAQCSPKRQSAPEETQKETFFSSPSRTDSQNKEAALLWGWGYGAPYLNFLAHIPAGVQKVSFSLETA